MGVCGCVCTSTNRDACCEDDRRFAQRHFHHPPTHISTHNECYVLSHSASSNLIIYSSLFGVHNPAAAAPLHRHLIPSWSWSSFASRLSLDERARGWGSEMINISQYIVAASITFIAHRGHHHHRRRDGDRRTLPPPHTPCSALHKRSGTPANSI